MIGDGGWSHAHITEDEQREVSIGRGRNGTENVPTWTEIQQKCAFRLIAIILLVMAMVR